MAKKHVCPDCGKSYASRSGLWKHTQKFQGSCRPDPVDGIHKSEDDGSHLKANDLRSSDPIRVTPEDSMSDGGEGSLDSVASPPPSPDPPLDTIGREPDPEFEDWAEFDLGIDEDVTEVIPAPLKVITAQDPRKTGRKPTQKELKAIRETETSILKAGLTGVDTILSHYGKGVTMNTDFQVVHSDQSKDLVANAQQEWLEEQGVQITAWLGKGAVAGILTSWYVGGPLLRIRKEAKKPMIKRIGGGAGSLMSRLPLIGRLFKKKKPENEFFHPIEGELEDEVRHA